MATYYKWAERQADTTINWAEVGKNMSDMLQEEMRLREAKKAAINEETRKLGDKLENMPMGLYEPANQFMLEFGASAQETRLIQDNLLRAGLLKPKDYAIQRQNLNDGTNTMIDLSKIYEEEYTTKLERIDNADPKQRSQAIESYLMERFEGLSNLTNTKAVINPTDGQVTLGRLVEKTVDGENVRVLSDNPADVFTVNELNMRLKQKFDYFDVDSYMQNQVNQLGTVKTMMLDAAKKSGNLNMIYSTIDAKEGSYITEAELAQLDAAIASAKNEDEKRAAEKRKQEAIAGNSYLRAEKNMIESIMTSPLYVSSILTENMMIDGKAYTPELDTKVVEELEKKILSAKTEEERAELQAQRDSIVLFEKKTTGALEPVFTDNQKAEVYDYLRIDLRKRISDSEEAKAAGMKPYSPGAAAYLAERGRQKAKVEENEGNFITWNRIYKTNDAKKVKEYFESLRSDTGFSFDTSSIKYNKDTGQIEGTVNVKSKDGSALAPITFPPSDQLMWSEQGKFIHGVDNQNTQIKFLKRNKLDPKYVKTTDEFKLMDGGDIWKNASATIIPKTDPTPAIADKFVEIAAGLGDKDIETVEAIAGKLGLFIKQKEVKVGDEIKTYSALVTRDGKEIESHNAPTFPKAKIIDRIRAEDPKSAGAAMVVRKYGTSEGEGDVIFNEEEEEQE